MRTLLVLISLLLVVAGAAGCNKDDAKKGPAPQDDLVNNPTGTGLGIPEAKRGLEICDHFVERLCACAKTDPSLADACRLQSSMPAALRMQLRAADGDDGLDGGPPSKRERAELEAQARKTINACLRADGELDPKVCPR